MTITKMIHTQSLYSMSSTLIKTPLRLEKP